MEPDVPGSKCSVKVFVKASQLWGKLRSDGWLQIFENLYVYLSKYFKPTKTTNSPSKNGLFDNVNSKKFSTAEAIKWTQNLESQSNEIPVETQV